MGAPKKKWSSEEETALKAGIAKYGLGRWTTIIKDPQFSHILFLRSNIDLKDKWRNMCVGTAGFGSREKVKAAFKGTDKIPKLDEKAVLLENGDNGEKPVQVVKHDEKPQEIAATQKMDEDVTDVKPLQTRSGSVQISNGSKKSISRMENVVLEAIISLKEPRGSNRANISTYIEDHYDTPLEFQGILSENLRALTASGKLLKVNGKYRIAPPNPNPNPNPNASRKEGAAVFEEKQRTPYKGENVEMRTLTESQVVQELAKIRTMNAKEAAEAAARAVAEAEAAIAVAEQAAKEAEAAEADAEAAEAFAEAALLTLKKTQNTWRCR